MTRKKQSNSLEIQVTIPYRLHTWSESLTFDELNDTLFLIGIYADPEYPKALSPADRKRVEKWLKNNDVNAFIKSKELASMAYGQTLENELYAAEIMGMPYKRAVSH